MSGKVSRRSFLRKSVLAPAGAALAWSFEEEALLAATTAKTPRPAAEGAAGRMPMGKIGNLTISRILVGGNLISGFAHSRDLVYVSSLLRQYFTDEKVWEITLHHRRNFRLGF